MIELPRRLEAPDPGWSTYADVVVIGSGIAGLTAALKTHALLSAQPGGGSVMVVTKDLLSAGSTRWAQGGIAAALGEGDSPEEHLRDTLVAGAGVCDEEAVRVLVTDGPERVRELIALGTNFDHSDTGELSLTREGGHHRDRIAHAGGDATGAEIQRALVAAVRAAPQIDVIEHALVLDLLPGVGGGIAGVSLHVMGEGQRDGVGAVHCRAVVLASGGLGQVFSATTNPSVATGDGMALALRAGARLRDLEFVQFHPTVMWLGADSTGQQPLISEAVRGEGAFLVDFEGNRFMQGRHELADLAPRDVVAKAIMRRMRETGREHLWLDARHFGPEKWETRFPTILASCREPRHRPCDRPDPRRPGLPLRLGRCRHRPPRPVVPARALRLRRGGLLGRPRGQPARVQLPCSRGWSSRVGSPTASPRICPPRREPAPDDRTPGLVAADLRVEVQSTMTERAGVLRHADGLAAGADALAVLAAKPAAEAATAAWETTNLLTVSAALLEAARLREETRGSHWREDFPETDELWHGHVDLTLTGDSLEPTFHPTDCRGPR